MPPGFELKMQAGGVASERSSSPMSSPPISPQNNGFSDTIRVSQRLSPNPGISGGGVVAAPSATPALAANETAFATNSNATTSAATSTTNANGTAPAKPKRQRKKKEVGPDGKPVADEKPKEKKPRKPRVPKEQTAGAPTAAPRKRVKKEEQAEKTPDNVPAIQQSRQPTITNHFQPPSQLASSNMPQPQQIQSHPQPQVQPQVQPQPPQPQHRISDSVMRNGLPPPTSNPSTPRPISSGQNYDPIRGSTMETSRPVNPPANGTQPSQPSQHVNRASASPSIASLIDPPTAIKSSAPPPTSYSPQTSVPQPFIPSQQYSSTPPKPAVSMFAPPPQQASPSINVANPVATIPTMDGAMDVEPTCQPVIQQPVPEIKGPSKASSSTAPTPKATRPTSPQAPKGTGSGLLSSSDLFGGPSTSEPSERKGVNIDLHIPLNPQGGNTINIAQEIVKKYGRDAINPRAAAHREHLLRIAAEQDRLGGASNDDMSVDLMSELEGDSNVDMGGMDDEKSNTGMDADGKPPRKRRKKVEEYDKEDDFIDDTELAWEEQAAVAKDGFFVYSGPLVPEGQAAQVESSAPTRGGRGRGRGRGSRSTAAGTTHASLAEKTRDTPTNGASSASAAQTGTSTRARGRGRGTGAPRKPRITKADRERMEAEKMDRERAAAHMGGPTGAPIALAPSPASGTVQPIPAAAPPAMPMEELRPPTQHHQNFAPRPVVGVGGSTA